MKRILYVHYQKNASEGSIVHVTRFSHAFRTLCQAAGIDFQVIAPPTVFIPPGEERPRLGGRLRRILGKYYLRELKVILQQIRKAWQERALLKAWQPDIVLTRYDAETLSIHWAGRSLGLPVVTEFNGKDRGELAGTYLDHKQIPLLNRLFSNCNALKWSAGAMAVSDDIADDMRACNPQNKPVIVNHNGVDLAEFDPQLDCSALRQSLDIPAGAVVVGYIGSFIIWHAPDRLFRAFASLLDQGVDAYLLLVGRKLPETAAMIDAAGPRVAARVRHAGFVPHAHIPQHLALMDIAVLPKTQAYCSPLKLFEYMAMAKACLVPATSTIASILDHDREGLLFDPESEADFTADLLRLASDRELRQRLGHAARQRVEAEYTWDHNAERVMQLLINAQSWHANNQ
ncbi:MAG: glycosyltransferase family 4 protein [Dechloromonas sp.]|nr:glycosyltransferase family 4 protein [Dechloromonas sp.]